MKHYVAIAGTNSKQSTNRQLIQYMQRHYQEQVTIELVAIDNLPLFEKNPKRTAPEAVHDLAQRIAQADGVIIATPEYDHAVPAVLSSALAWLSYREHPFAGKPVLIIGASYGALGTTRAQAQLRLILDSPEVRASVMPSSEFMVPHSLEAFDEAGDLKDAKLVRQLDGLMADFDIFIDIVAQLVHRLAESKAAAANVDWTKAQA